MVNYEDHHMCKRWKEDSRPAKNLWVPGDYIGRCPDCGADYIGAKRSAQCADCAYADPGPLLPVQRQEKWDRRFLGLAATVASWSKDPSTKVGAVIVRLDLTVASLGFNGFPRGLPDTVEHYEDREIKYQRVVHAEANAVVHAREPLHGHTIYVWPFPPCAECTKLIIQAGISRVVSLRPTAAQRERWGASLTAAENMLLDCHVAATFYDPASFGPR